MPEYYDDNFGHWDGIEDDDSREFYWEVQNESVEKTCEGCGRIVRLMPDYGFCNSCMVKIERGEDIY